MDGVSEAPAFDYPALMRAALVGVVRTVLARVADEGLPGEHHFYLTFGTGDDGVEVPPSLRRQFPDEMTIVLQHQFWNLAVDDAGFSVTLRFSGQAGAPRRPVAGPARVRRPFGRVRFPAAAGGRREPCRRRCAASPRRGASGGCGSARGRVRRAPAPPEEESAHPGEGERDEPPGAAPGPRKVVDIGPFRRGPGTGREG